MKKINLMPNLYTKEILEYLDTDITNTFEKLQLYSQDIIQNFDNLDPSIIEHWDNHMFNNPESCFVHGMSLMELGELKEGKDYINRAAKLNYSLANFFLADCYVSGKYEFEKNKDKAIPFYMQACKYGERPACQNVYNLLKEKYSKTESMRIIREEIGIGRFLLGVYFPFINKLLGKKECPVPPSQRQTPLKK